jgi:diguanylate cyclase (GGDEF)-like protein/PAS domain S-box-containing protein
MLQRVRALDWAATPLGPAEAWPERLRGSVSLALTSRFPLMVAWGPELVQVYNDGYLPIFGQKHPQLGVAIKDTWPEIWHVIEPMLRGVLETREATWAEDLRLWIDRLGFPEDAYFTFSYSPVLDEEGVARGVLATAVETTESVLSARRNAVVSDVIVRRATDPHQAAVAALDGLSEHGMDVPFALVHLDDGDLVATCGPVEGCDLPGAWPLRSASDRPRVVPVPASVQVLHEASGVRVRDAALVRLGEHGTLVLGLSPGRRIDEAHLGFVSALGVHITAALSVGKGFAEERAMARERLDVIERELAANRAAEAERFRFAGARAGTWTLDLVNESVILDENVERLFGVEPGTMHTLQDVLVRVDPADRKTVQKQLDVVIADGGEVLFHFGVALPNGERRVFQSRGTAARGPDGHPGLLHGALWDATDLVAAQEEARRADEGLRTALDVAPWGSALVEPDGRLSRVNPALCDLLGRDRDALVGLPLAELLHPDDDVGLALDGSGAVRDVRLAGPGGDVLWVALSSAPVRGADGSVVHTVVHVHDQSERKRMQADLQRLADEDPLTGLLNRRRFAEEVERALVESWRSGDGAVLMVDMDGLKHVNDTLGHGVGDVLLVALADVLRARLRTTDVLARLGGDEFAVVCPATELASAEALAADLVASFAQATPLGVPVSICVGVSALSGGDRGRRVADVLSDADVALYRAKDAGRGQVRTLRRSASATTPRPQRRWPERIRAALEADGFVLHTQPIVSLHGEGVERAELLLRMVGDDGRLLLPQSFLLAAERSTLIQEIDRWVVHSAVQELALRQAGTRPTSLAVNLSARSLNDPTMAAFVLDELDEAGADPSGLVLEVTETAAVINVGAAHAFISTVTSHGCELALDDFGAGFTSLQYLTRLDFDYLKIDGAYVRDLLVNPVNRSIVGALAGLAASLGKRTIAEHVGDPGTLTWLAEHGVDFAQGFHLGLPVPLPARQLEVVPRRSRVSG